jgi:hypothetical protein
MRPLMQSWGGTWPGTGARQWIIPLDLWGGQAERDSAEKLPHTPTAVLLEALARA